MIALRHIAVATILLLVAGATQAAGIVFTFGSNITAERQAALEAAATELEQQIHFRQNIKVSVSFNNLSCSSNSATLGFAGPQTAYSNFPGAPQSNVWYVSGQVADMGVASAMDDTLHIDAQFNHNLGNAGCLTGITWYFGADHNPAVNQVDFLATAVHEFMHGLGFLSFIGSNGQLNGGLIDNYSTFLMDNSSGKSWKNMTNAERAASILNNGNLVWNGAKTTAMASLLSAGKTNGKVRLFAPSSYQSGSSTSHFDTAVHYASNADEVMEPFDAFPQSSIMATAVFCDIGWQLLRDTDSDGTNDCDDTDPLAPPVLTDSDGDGVPDTLDAFPNDPTESVDTDGDGTGNNADTDDDNDGVLDGADNCPLVSNATQLDYDNDGTGDACGDPLPMPMQGGEAAKDSGGFAVAFAGDVDNDGYGDYVFGVPKHDVLSPMLLKDAGQAVVISGRSGVALFGIEGTAAKDQMGFAVAGGGDIDGDGFDDVVAGAPGAASGKLADAGSATILFGPDGVRRETFVGTTAKALAGSVVALADFENSGKPGVLIGAPKDDDLAHDLRDTGSVMLVSGGATRAVVDTLYGASAKALFGSSVAAGAVNAASGDEIIVGAPGENGTGSVSVFAAGNPVPLIKKFGAVAKARFGAAVASGDVNGDGRDDVIVGAPGDDDVTRLFKDAGSISVYSGNGGGELEVVYGDRPKALLGSSVSAGDVNGDGKVDVVGGAPKDDNITTKRLSDAGSVTVWRWTGTALDALGTTYGGAAKDYFGTAVSAGDIDGDGKAELMAGAPGDEFPDGLPVKDAGSVTLLSGAGF